MHPLERRVLRTVRREGLIRPAARGLVLVSGGADSLALLYLLHALRGPLNLTLEVVHFDHGLRPESADEAEWVAKRAATLALPVHIVRTEHLARLKSGVQAAARAWRGAETRRLLAQWEANWAATGHQREDQLETLLLKLLRGVHISHLEGMRARGGPYIRPLLQTRRAEITAYLRDRGVAWLEDPSNQSPKYKRNRVRHELLGLLDELADGCLATRLAQVESQSRQVAQLVEHTLRAHPVRQSAPDRPPHWIEVGDLLRLPPLAREALLHRFVAERMPGALDYAQVERAMRLLERGAPLWSLDWPHGRLLKRRGDRLLLQAQPSLTTADGDAVRRHRLAEWWVSAPASWGVRQLPPEANGGLTLYNVPPSCVLQLRQRRAGDRFHPPWKRHTVKLSAFLRDQHYPLWEREQLPLVVLEGHVIGVYPRFVAQGYHRPMGATRPLRLEIRPG